MFYDPGNNGARGQGAAQDNICPQDSIFVRLEGNTFHGHSRFGSYFLGAVFPKKTDQSFANNGLLTDPKSCRALLDDGTDNGVGVVVDGNIDYDNVFVGGYDYGDVQYRNHISTNNNNLIYWKSTKAFADGCSSHFADSFYGTGNLALPDQAAVVFENTRFEGGVHFESGHHCNIGTTGVLCSPMYVFEKCQFDINGNGPAFEFHSEANTYGGIFTLSPPDEANLAGGLFPAGYSTLISSAFPYVLELPAACVKASSLGVAAGVKYADGILCKPTLRSIKIYTFGLTPGTASQLNVEFLKAGKLITSFKRPYHQVGLPIGEKQGYAFPAFIGADVEYRISLDKPGSPNIPADWVIEFSDPIFGNRWGKEVVKLTVAGRTCPPLTSSQHDRKFIYADSDHYLGVKAHGRGACSVHPDSPAKTCPAKTTIDSVTCPSKCPGECNNGFCDCGLQKCMCSPGFSGPNCEIDTCAAGRCGVHGRCAAKYLGGSIPVNEGACICEPGWSGPLCDQNCNAGICEAPIATIPDAECTKDGDFCTSVPGGLCKAGACVAPATPVTDAECINDGDVCTSIAGGLCKAGACVAPDAECANDGDACTSILGGSCEAGICVAPDIPVNDEKCTKDGDACSSFVGGICNAGICVAPATSVPDAECTKDGDACTSVPGGSCQTGKCVASLVLPVGTECANDDDVCASVPGGLCKAGACVAPATPVTDAECINDGDVCTSIAGGLCNAGICVAPAAPIIDAECINDGDICTSIAGGSCKAGVCVALMASVPDAECAKDGDACSSIEGGQCKSGECVAPVTPTGEDECIQEGASCTSIDGGVCKAGECVAPETPTTDEECTRDGASCTSVDGGICQSGKCLSVLTECDNAADNQPCTSVKGGKCSGGICKAAKPFPTHHVPKPHDCRNLHL